MNTPEELQRELERTQKELERTKKALRTVVEELTKARPCFACLEFYRNGGACMGGSACVTEMMKCRAAGQKYTGPHWKWRGPQKEDGNNEQ